MKFFGEHCFTKGVPVATQFPGRSRASCGSTMKENLNGV
jgi:hypothetical protein